MPTLRELTPKEAERRLLNLPPEVLHSIQKRIDKLPVPLIEDLISHRHISRKAKLRYGIAFSRHEQRRLAIETLYHHLLFGKSIDDALYETLLQSEKVSQYLYDLTVGMEPFEEEYIEAISGKLRKDWSWDRLSKMDQAILLVALHELRLGQVPRAVVIDEAVENAKEFGDENSYKLVNGILDSL